MSKIDDVIKKVQSLIKAYNPDQPRDPGGEGGGQWTSEGGSDADGSKYKAQRAADERSQADVKRQMSTTSAKPKASGAHPSGGSYRLDSYGEIYMDKMPTKQRFAAVIRSKAGARLKVASWHDSMSEVNAEVERLRSSGTHQAMATGVRTK